MKACITPIIMKSIYLSIALPHLFITHRNGLVQTGVQPKQVYITVKSVDYHAAAPIVNLLVRRAHILKCRYFHLSSE